MKIQIAFTILIFSSVGAFAQKTSEDLNKEVIRINKKVNSIRLENEVLKLEIRALDSKIANANNEIDSLRMGMQGNTNTIAKNAKEFGITIKATRDQTTGKITEVSESLSKTSLYGIIGVLSAILLSGVLYWLLSKKQKTDKTDFEGQLSKTKKTIEEEQIQITTKLAELYNGQMAVLKMERKANAINGEVDHSLPLKVADEIVKMQMNLVHMDNKVRGHRHLSIAVGNVFDNFKANGYEIIDHLNKPYNDGMNMQATKEPDPNLKEGEQVIRRIIKPEIHFNNKIIQHAQVIVAYGE